jgi:hypothetical protein
VEGLSKNRVLCPRSSPRTEGTSRPSCFERHSQHRTKYWDFGTIASHLRFYYAITSAFFSARSGPSASLVGCFSRPEHRLHERRLAAWCDLQPTTLVFGHLLALKMELSPPSPDSEHSLISIDSAIARQISRSKSSHQPLSITAKQHSPARAAEEQTNESHHAIRNEHSGGKPLPKSLEKTRKNSLRRVKNSTEVLRQRSTRAQHGVKPSDGTSASKEARNFTVGSVGTGGKLYLRYALSQPTPKIMLIHFWF